MTLVWARQNADFNTSDKSNVSPIITCDTKGNTYFAFARHTNNAYPPDMALTDNIKLVKMNSNGNVVWTKDITTHSTISGLFEFWNNRPFIVANDDYIYMSCMTTSVFINEKTKNNDFNFNNGGTCDIVIIKFSTSNGKIIWSKQNDSFNTQYNCLMPCLDIDDNNNVYVAYYGFVTNGTTNIPSKIHVFKLDENGHTMWHTSANELNTDENNKYPCIKCGTSGVYVMYLGNGKIDNYENKNYGLFGAVVLKLSKDDGNLLWISKKSAFNTKNSDIYPVRITDITLGSLDVDTNDNIICGYSIPNPSEINGKESNSFASIVLFKLTKDGKFVWVHQSNDINRANKQNLYPIIKVDKYNNIYCVFVSGDSDQTLEGAELYKLILFKLDDSQNVIWKQMNELPNTVNTNISAYLTINGQGDIFVCYSTDGAISGSERVSNYNNGDNIIGHDIVVFKLSENTIPITLKCYREQVVQNQLNLETRVFVGDSFNKITQRSFPKLVNTVNDPNIKSFNIVGYSSGGSMTSYCRVYVSLNDLGHSEGSTPFFIGTNIHYAYNYSIYYRSLGTLTTYFKVPDAINVSEIIDASPTNIYFFRNDTIYYYCVPENKNRSKLFDINIFTLSSEDDIYKINILNTTGSIIISLKNKYYLINCETQSTSLVDHHGSNIIDSQLLYVSGTYTTWLLIDNGNSINANTWNDDIRIFSNNIIVNRPSFENMTNIKVYMNYSTYYVITYKINEFHLICAQIEGGVITFITEKEIHIDTISNINNIDFCVYIDEISSDEYACIIYNNKADNSIGYIQVNMTSKTISKNFIVDTDVPNQYPKITFNDDQVKIMYKKNNLLKFATCEGDHEYFDIQTFVAPQYDINVLVTA